MTRADRIAIIISLLAVLVSYQVAERIFERMAHIEDEMAYVWQAQAITRNQLTLPSPPEPDSFLVPFIVDYNGNRFGKYPLGWPALLSLGIRLGNRAMVNSLLAGLGVWLTYRLGKKLLSESVGLLAAGLTVTSPFFLMNSGSLLSHPFGLVLSTAFVISWLDAFCEPDRENRILPALAAGSTLGLLVLTRPLTAIAVGFPFGLHALYLLFRSSWQTRRLLIWIGLIVLTIGTLHFLWQYALTGDALLNPYTLWWEYDKIGFGPGYGVIPEGHSLNQARVNTRHSLWVGQRDLFGWGAYSWIFLVPGLWAILRNWRALLVASVAPSLIVIYMAYWIGSALLGPRYYYEGFFALSLTSAAGIAWLAGWPLKANNPFPNYKGWKRARALTITTLLALLVTGSSLFYTPMRLKGLFGLYGVQRSYLEPFETRSAQALSPALIIVHTERKWIEYGRLLELQDPFLDTPFIFIISRHWKTDEKVAAAFPDRNIFHYYTGEPYKFYTAPRIDP